MGTHAPPTEAGATQLQPNATQDAEPLLPDFLLSPETLEILM